MSIIVIKEISSLIINERGRPGTTITDHSELILDDGTNPHGTTKSDVGLSNADNTSDINKPISSTTQISLDLKADDADLSSHEGNILNPHSVTKTQVGLSNVDNTSDTDKPVSIATQTALNLKAPQTEVDLNTTHRTSDGSDHSFINQDVKTTSDPTFNSAEITTRLNFADTNELKIQLNGSAANYYGVSKLTAINGGDGLYKITTGATSAGEFALDSGGSIKLFIDKDGNSGWGTTNPTYKSHFYKNDAELLPSVLIENDGTGDASIGFLRTDIQGWSIGIDGTDNKFKISTSQNDVGTNTKVTVSLRSGNMVLVGSVQVGDDTDTASIDKVGARRYRTDANNSYTDICMQTGAITYAWVNIKTNNW